jgi:carboxyl-terminal processing protease
MTEYWAMRTGCPIPVAAALGAVLFIGACAGTGETTKAIDREFSRSRAVEVFAAGFSGVADKYIDTIPVEDLAFDGMRGLGSIDPGLTVKRVDNDVALFASGREAARIPAPAAGDVGGWAKAAVDISVAARDASGDLKAADGEAIYEAVFDGVLSRLDIFSRYAGAEEARRNRAKRDGFGGIGVRYKFEEGLPVIAEVLADSPAEGAGIQPGDRITRVDGVSIKGMDKRLISEKLRGPIHTLVEVTIERPGVPQPISVSMARGHIFNVTVTETHKDGIIYLRIRSFNQDTSRALATALDNGRAAVGDRLKGLILDLRGNPGGLLKQSVKVADLLLTQGQIVSTRGRHADSIHNYEAGGRDLAGGLPVIVLVDGKSASAAEIVAAALQDRERAVVVGTASFGKGSVQTVIRLPNDGEITLTWSRLYAPSGYMLHGLGVLPAICTSGAPATVPEKAADGAADLLKRVMANRASGEKTLSAWRVSGAFDDAKRNRLREACPSQRRPDDLEVEVARRLLENKALYVEALGMAAAVDQAHY